MKPTNTKITISDLGDQRTFVSGSKYWFIEWAKFNGNTFKEGMQVKWFDTDHRKWIKGPIEWLIITDNGSVEVSIDALGIGRLPLEEIKLVSLI
jgi:hypothetical protein